MARFEVRIKPSAVKEIEAIPRKRDRRQIVARIAALGEDPRPRGCLKLSGRQRYRLRQGDYRIIFSIDDPRLTVLVVGVRHRRDAYR